MSTFPASSTTENYDHYRSLLEKSCGCQSLLKASLTRETFDFIKNRRTNFGETLPLLIRSGIQNLDSSVGVYATDAEAYQTFSPLLEQVISLYHGVSLKSSQPPLYFGNPDHFCDLDPLQEICYFYSDQMCQYTEIEGKITDAMQKSSTTLRETYRTLASISAGEKAELRTQHYLFGEVDRFLNAANAGRFWPECRGIFYNDDKSILLWVNEEDHLRIISMQEGADILHIYEQLIETINVLVPHLEFEHSERYGYLASCPTNIGTTIRASVLIRLPRLGCNESMLHDIAKSYNIQVRGTHGEHSAVEGYNFEISNHKRFGLTEFNAVKSFHDGVKKLIQIEASS